MKDLEFGIDLLPNQRSLGLNWNLETDTFFFEVMTKDKSFTRRGILSCINSIFDPLGFLAPVVIQGKNILRNLVLGTKEWDEPLSEDQLDTWRHWRDSLIKLEDLHISRNYFPESLKRCKEKRIHVFCDASEFAIAAAGYIMTTSSESKCHTGFVLGKAKLTPTHGHSIPRLELCAAVLAVEVGCSIADHLSLQITDFKFYSDSKVVLDSRSFLHGKFLCVRVAFLQHVTRSFAGLSGCSGWHYCTKSRIVEAFQEAEKFIVRTVQQEVFTEEIDYLMQNKALPESSSLLSLDVFLDPDGIPRVGGRLNRSNMP
ncbi:uncharacterized protein LOC133179596 [Saccostrea echinata]|uniref:uncharacterized protein LOC133179596 n=1 Tax=Saccostrea echinata TaxID=191078 RepID=UPI002A83A267|nr:uncharacterized protein LOC133179596 [Saccostrea echinata]